MAQVHPGREYVDQKAGHQDKAQVWEQGHKEGIATHKRERIQERFGLPGALYDTAPNQIAHYDAYVSQGCAQPQPGIGSSEFVHKEDDVERANQPNAQVEE